MLNLLLGLHLRLLPSLSVFLPDHSPCSVILGWVSQHPFLRLHLAPDPSNSQAVGYFKPKLKTPLCCTAAIPVCGLFTLTWLGAMVLVRGAPQGGKSFQEASKGLCRDCLTATYSLWKTQGHGWTNQKKTTVGESHITGEGC